MNAPGGEATLRGLIADEMARWDDDHRRGHRTVELPNPSWWSNAPSATSPADQAGIFR